MCQTQLSVGTANEEEKKEKSYVYVVLEEKSLRTTISNDSLYLSILIIIQLFASLVRRYNMCHFAV